MPFPNIELPSDFHVEPLKKPFDKRDNLRHFGRVKGVQNKICRDLKNGLLDAAIEHGADGTGAGGLRGYLLMLATRYPTGITCGRERVQERGENFIDGNIIPSRSGR